jgi:hypothetical protein
MGAWFWIVLIIVVAAIAVWLRRRGTLGRGYTNDHQGEREANRHRFDDPRGSGPSMLGGTDRPLLEAGTTRRRSARPSAAMPAHRVLSPPWRSHGCPSTIGWDSLTIRLSHR